MQRFWRSRAAAFACAVSLVICGVLLVLSPDGWRHVAAPPSPAPNSQSRPSFPITPRRVIAKHTAPVERLHYGHRHLKLSQGDEGGNTGDEPRADEVEKGARALEQGELPEEDPSGGSWECSPLRIAGLENCSSEWNEKIIVRELLSLKRDMLRQIVQVLDDPTSAGRGGNPQEPLLLVQKLAIDEADAVVGAGTPVYLNKVTDAGGWNPELGGMNRWIARYHKEVLRESRPVIIHVHGDDACALENEISRSARAFTVQRESLRYGDAYQRNNDSGGSPSTWQSWANEDFDVPLALMTFGWDPAGDPTHSWREGGRDISCARRILDLKRVTVWFTSHTQNGSRHHRKLRYLPIGFGGFDTRNGLPQSVYVDNAKQRLRLMEDCPHEMEGSYVLLFACNTLERYPRAEIWHSMTSQDGKPIPVNLCPLTAIKMVPAATSGIFAVSPPGTGPDCFRHYEMILEGNIALVPDDKSLRSFMGGLPVFFMGKTLAWGELTCDLLLHLSRYVREAIRDESSPGLVYEKLTQGYWRDYIRETMLEAAGLPNDAEYIEHSVEPLDPPGWNTFRRVGCFAGRSNNKEVVVLSHKRHHSPESCAKICRANKNTQSAATSFFGVTTTSDRNCWCSNDVGYMVPEVKCDQPSICQTPKGCIGSWISNVFSFGPSDALEYIYHGCYGEHTRFMYHAQQKFASAMTPPLCAAFCASLRYPFFAVERSEWCRCGVMTRYAATSIRDPAWEKNDALPLEKNAPDPTTAALPFPGATIGDPKFQCTSPCAGNSTIMGCGGKRAWDLYSLKMPCILFQECTV